MAGPYYLREIDGIEYAKHLRYLNSLEPDKFPPLLTKHLYRGFWYVAQCENGAIAGFAGMVPMTPFEDTGYLKRAYVMPAHRGNGLQCRFIAERETKAVEIGWRLLVSEFTADNATSASNFIKAGFQLCEPEQCWGAPGSLYFVKRL